MSNNNAHASSHQLLYGAVGYTERKSIVSVRGASPQAALALEHEQHQTVAMRVL